MTNEKVLFLGPADAPLRAWLQAQGNEVVQTEAAVSADVIADAGFTFLVSHGYRHILRRDVLELFAGRAVNLHISYLPWNRGADPNLWSFVDDTPKGVTIHRIDEGVDTGDILVQEEVRLEVGDTLATSYAKLQSSIQDLFRRSWEQIRTGELPGRPQPAGGSRHRLRDRVALADLLADGWDTPVSTLRGQGLPGGDVGASR
ncbi:formyltransferase family protein [Nocardioides sp. YIM 152315]|uniref:formyltransferase family protein n=1 Tax=Nocardioides sp. YIM 152315 TaxID=3031760 RepID=UPI0023DA7522|nr:formyltransferase family protein [Nocardioides sp. YIM 152315]MDF1604889.1 formyltransferase family protein [Nocardioides sp. YIM 152315]